MKNPLSIEAFADWCEKQPAEREYDYISRPCACEQYGEFLGMRNKGMGIWDHWKIGKGADYEAMTYPRTFGALAARLRAKV